MTTAPSNPYRGLRPYESSDSELFFGRKRLTQRLLDRLAAGGRLHLLSGACGVGKTSLLQAGVLPALTGLGLRGYVIGHPSLDPFEQLRRQGVVGADEDLGLALRGAAGPLRPLLVIDHGEELVTAGGGLPQRNLVQQLQRILEAPAGQDAGLLLLLAVRSDFLAPLVAAVPWFLPWVEQPSIHVAATLELSEWMAMVREPAGRVGTTVEPALLTALSTDLEELHSRGEERLLSPLLLLSFVLHKLWERSEGTALRVADYQQLGGLRQALTRTADAAWSTLPSHNSARRALLSLVATQGDGANTLLLPRPLPLSEWRLQEGAASSSLEATSAATVMALYGSGLLHIDEAHDSVELIHAGLLEHWPKLRTLYREEQDFLHWHREMVTMVLPARDGAPAAEGGGSEPRPAAEPAPLPSALSGNELAEAERWLTERPAEIDASVRRLIEQSQASRISRLQFRSRPPLAMAPSVTAGVPWPLALGVGLVILLSVMALQRFVHHGALRGTELSLAAERGARASILVMQPGQDSSALSLAIRAVAPTLRDGMPVPQLAKEGLMTAYSVAKNSQPLHGHTDRVDSAVFDPSGMRVLTASTDRTARIWDAHTGRQLMLFAGHRAMLTTAIFSPDGGLVLTTSSDGTARIWEVASGRLLHELLGHDKPIEMGQFSADGQRVVTAGHDGTARLWEVRTGRLLHVLSGHSDRVTAALFSRDGRRILTTSWDRSARIWDGQSGQPLHTLSGHSHRLNLAAFSADGTRVATASWDQTVRLWNLSELTAHNATAKPAVPPTAPGPLPAPSAAASPASAAAPGSTAGAGGGAAAATFGSIILRHEERIQSLVFSPDGKWLATAGSNGLLKLWDGRSGELKARLSGHYGSIFGLDFAADSQHFVSAGTDRTVRLWNVGVERAVAVLYGHSAHIYTAAFSPSGARVVTASYDQTARIWDVRAGQPVAILQGHRRGVTSATFSRSGSRIVTTSEDHTARLWAWPGGAEVATLPEHTNLVNMAAFSPDGSLIATASSDHDVRLWDGQTGRALRVLRGHNTPVFAVAFSPSGERLVSAGADHVLRFWDPQTGAQTAEVSGHSGNTNWLAFSPDGRLMVSAGSEGETWVRDGHSGAQLRMLRGHTGRVNRAEFFMSSGTGGDLRLATASSDRSVRMWDPHTGTVLSVLSGFADEVSSVSPSPDGRRLLIVSGEQGVRLWDVAAEMPLTVLPGFFEESITASYGWPDGRYFIIASSDGLTKVYTDDYPANLAGTLSAACALLRYQREFERVKADCPSN
jgi:WD40 repeat protein